MDFGEECRSDIVVPNNALVSWRETAMPVRWRPSDERGKLAGTATAVEDRRVDTMDSGTMRDQFWALEKKGAGGFMFQLDCSYSEDNWSSLQ